VNRIGRRTIMCMPLIVALLVIWQAFGPPGDKRWSVVLGFGVAAGSV
jgi:hypothetical protein